MPSQRLLRLLKQNKFPSEETSTLPPVSTVEPDVNTTVSPAARMSNKLQGLVSTLPQPKAQSLKSKIIGKVIHTLTDKTPEGQGFGMKTGDWLDRLQRVNYASANAAKEALYNPKPDYGRAVWAGLTGRSKGSYRDIAERQHLPGPFWWGLAGDIGLDPTTYLTAGMTSIPKAGAKVGTKALALKMFGKPILKSAKAAEALSGMGKAAMKIPAVAETVKKFHFTTGIDKLDDMVKRSLLSREYNRAQAIHYGWQTANKLQKLAKTSGQDLDSVMSSVVNVIEKSGGVPAKMLKMTAKTPELGQLAIDLNTQFGKYLAPEVKLGITAPLGSSRQAQIVKLTGELEGAIGEKKQKIMDKLNNLRKVKEAEMGQLRTELPKGYQKISGKKLYERIVPPAVKGEQPLAGGMIHETPRYVREKLAQGVKITETKPAAFRITEPVDIKDVHGASVSLPKGHEFTEVHLSNGKVWLHDGKNLVVDRSSLQSLPKKSYLKLGEMKEIEDDITMKVSELGDAIHPTWRPTKNKNFRDITFQVKGGQYLEPHFSSTRGDKGEVQRGIFANARVSDGILPSGGKVLYIEELQSEWTRELRKKTTEKVHPYTKNWDEVALKKLTKYAMDNGYEGITFSKGSDISQLYGLKQYMKSVEYIKAEGNKGYKLSIQSADGPSRTITVKANMLEDYVGADVAQKILRGEGTPTSRISGSKMSLYKKIEFEDVESEWTKNLYDVRLPGKLKEITQSEFKLSQIQKEKGNLLEIRQFAKEDNAGKNLIKELEEWDLSEHDLLYNDKTKRFDVGAEDGLVTIEDYYKLVEESQQKAEGLSSISKNLQKFQKTGGTDKVLEAKIVQEVKDVIYSYEKNVDVKITPEGKVIHKDSRSTWTRSIKDIEEDVLDELEEAKQFRTLAKSLEDGSVAYNKWKTLSKEGMLPSPFEDKNILHFTPEVRARILGSQPMSGGLPIRSSEQKAIRGEMIAALHKAREAATWDEQQEFLTKAKDLQTQLESMSEGVKPTMAVKPAVAAAGKVITPKAIKVKPTLTKAYKGVARKLMTREDQMSKLDTEAARIGSLPITSKEITKTAGELKVGRARAAEITKLRRQRELGYFPRFTREEVQVFFKNAYKSGAGSRVWNPKIKEALARKTGEFTLEEFNKFAAEHGLESLGGNAVQEFFMKDPAYGVALRGVHSANAVSSGEFLQKAAKTFGTAKDIAGYLEAPESLQKAMPALKGIKFDPMVMKEINRAYSYMIKPDTLNFFVRKVFDPIQNLWKAHVLAYFPAYHFRNMVGNMWNNYLGGVFNPIDYQDAAKLQIYRSLKERGIKVTKPRIGNLDVDKIIEEGEKLGVSGKGFLSFEVPKTIQAELSKGNWNIFSQRFHLIKGGRAVGRTVEDNARWTHFINKIKKGYSPWDAANSVKKYLFDYGELTDFERTFMKRVFPFYTWSRKNIPLQIEAMITEPGKTAVLPKIKSAIEYGKEQPKNESEVVPPWIYDRMPIRFGKSKGPEGRDEYKYLPLESFIPFADISKLNRPLGAMGEMLTPLAKLPAELAFNKSLYTGKQIANPAIPGERVPFLGREMNPRAAYALKSIRLLSELDRWLQKPSSTQAELSPKEKVVRALTGAKIERVDPEMQLRFKLLEKKNQLNELRKAYKRASDQGRTKEADRLQGLMKTEILDYINRLQR
jgi:hypothetical protein